VCFPSTVSSFIQRAGRAARGPERSGLAVLLVEKSVYNADLSKINVNISFEAEGNLKGRKKGVRQSSTYPKATKDYSIQHGVQRGDATGSFDNMIGTCVVNLDSNSIDEGLYTLAQSTTCRRGVLTKIYGNDSPR
jgi:superfamily II DNA/RNA helicase